MGHARFDQIAEALITGYLETLSHRREFLDRHGNPPTRLHLAHHLRSVVQAEVLHCDSLTLAEPFVEFGRVEITELATGDRFVLQSEASLAVENSVSQHLSLFDPVALIRSTTKMLVYGFQEDGLALSLTGAVARPGRRKLYASGPPAPIGFWSYDQTRSAPFDQNVLDDPFSDLGDLDMNDEADAG